MTISHMWPPTPAPRFVWDWKGYGCCGLSQVSGYLPGRLIGHCLFAISGHGVLRRYWTEPSRITDRKVPGKPVALSVSLEIMPIPWSLAQRSREFCWFPRLRG